MAITRSACLGLNLSEPVAHGLLNYFVRSTTTIETSSKPGPQWQTARLHVPQQRDVRDGDVENGAKRATKTRSPARKPKESQLP
jgi:hypothetical protein